MQVKDIIALAAGMLQKPSAVQYLGADPSDRDPAEETEINRFLQSYNLTVSEISEEYERFTATEVLKSNGGAFSLADLKRPPLKIISCKNLAGEDVKFTVETDRIIADESVITVLYVCVPTAKTFDEALPDFSLRITARLLALGVAREFLLASGQFEEAVVYDERFRSALAALSVSKRRNKISARGWY